MTDPNISVPGMTEPREWQNSRTTESQEESNSENDQIQE